MRRPTGFNNKPVPRAATAYGRQLKTHENSTTVSTLPKVDVPNALGQVKSQLNDDFTSVALLKEDEENLPEDFSLSNEAKLFSGEKNAVLLTRKFSQDHACNFNLFYFPFDTQVRFWRLFQRRLYSQWCLIENHQSPVYVVN